MRAVRDLKSCCHQRSLCPQIDEGDFQLIALRCGCYAPGTQNIILYVFDVPFLDGKDLRSVPLGMRRAILQARMAVSAGQIACSASWTLMRGGPSM